MSEDLSEFKQFHKTVFLSPGKVISMTILNQRGFSDTRLEWNKGKNSDGIGKQTI